VSLGHIENIYKIFSRCGFVKDKGIEVKKVIVLNWRMSDKQWVVQKIRDDLPLVLQKIEIHDDVDNIVDTDT